ncbi:MAG TPA: DUF3800 domain-containing protein [Xanthobacteraceae bacterium]|jgi:hypothetical protein
MWFAYLDESHDENRFFVYSALIVDTAQWAEAFKALKDARARLRQRRGVYMKQELHAWKFAAGKGQIANRPILKLERAEIFRRVLSFLAETNLFRVISSANQNEFYAFDRIMNRINRTAEEEGQHVILICDQGQEAEFTRRMRKMRVHNPITSKYGAWENGRSTKNIPTAQILEDPFFKDSKNSYFIQAVDFCAYALLRMERPIPSRTALGYDTMYRELAPIVVTAANPNDPKKLGIIR